MLNSLLLHNKDSDLHVYLIYDNVDSEQLGLAASHLHQVLPGFSLLQASSKPLEGLPFDGHATIATYFRLLLPEILPAAVDKVLFIDSDAIVSADLSSLWHLPLQGRALAAIAEHRVSCSDHGYAFGHYFNAGVMLVDLEKWRQSDLLRKGKVFAKNNPDRLRHWDQDVLNHVFEDDWLMIPDRWNACPHLFGLTGEYDYNKYLFTEAEQEAIHNPAIIHYAGPGKIKPWNALCIHPLKDRYLEAKALTPWSDLPLDNMPPPAWIVRYQEWLFKTKCLLRERLKRDS